MSKKKRQRSKALLIFIIIIILLILVFFSFFMYLKFFQTFTPSMEYTKTTAGVSDAEGILITHEIVINNPSTGTFSGETVIGGTFETYPFSSRAWCLFSSSSQYNLQNGVFPATVDDFGQMWSNWGNNELQREVSIKDNIVNDKISCKVERVDVYATCISPYLTCTLERTIRCPSSPCNLKIGGIVFHTKILKVGVECPNNEEKCLSSSYYLCENNKFVNKGLTVDKCGIECVNSVDCGPGKECDMNICKTTEVVPVPTPTPTEVKEGLDIYLILGIIIIVVLFIILLIVFIRRLRK